MTKGCQTLVTWLSDLTEEGTVNCCIGQLNKIWQDTAMLDFGTALQCHISLLCKQSQRLTGLCNIPCPTWGWHLVRLASWRIWLVGPASVRNAIMRCLGKLVPCWGNILKVSWWSTLCVWFISAVVSTLKLEKRGRVFQLKRIKLFMEHFFLQRQHVNPALEANVSKIQKRTHDLSFLAQCTIHHFQGASTSRLSLSPSLASTDHLELEVFRPNLEVSLVWKALASHLEVRQTTLKSNTQRSPVLQIQT